MSDQLSKVVRKIALEMKAHRAMGSRIEELDSWSRQLNEAIESAAALPAVPSVPDDAARIMGRILETNCVTMQAAWIEWQHGKGAEAAMSWIHNTLWGPGLIPDENEPYAKEAQAWFDAHRPDAFPACRCGRPSNILWMGKDFCCNAHYQEAKAATPKAQPAQGVDDDGGADEPCPECFSTGCNGECMGD